MREVAANSVSRRKGILPLRLGLHHAAGDVQMLSLIHISPAQTRENIMGTMEINPLLVKLSVPMMISMLVQALYNVVDSVFVSDVYKRQP